MTSPAARPRRTRARQTHRPETGIGQTRWIAGVDAGGTWIRLLAMPDVGRARSVAVAASAVPLAEVLRALWRRLGLAAGRVDALVVASRGIWTRGERRAGARRLAGLARRVRAISDVEAAHAGALGDAPGVLLLAGTGSIALARDARGRWARAGGLGPLFGDGGSAFAIGRDWLAADAAPGTAARARALALGPEPVARIAALAPAVLARARRGHPRARRVVAGAQAALAALVVDLARRAALTRPVAVSWAGGLLADARFRGGVWRAVRRRGVAIAPRAPRGDAAGAALAMAGAMRGLAPAIPDRQRPRGRERPTTSTRRRR